MAVGVTDIGGGEARGRGAETENALGLPQLALTSHTTFPPGAVLLAPAGQVES